MNTEDPELRYLLALTRALFLNPAAQNRVMDAVGSAEEAYHLRDEMAGICPDLSKKNAQSIAAMDQHLERADQEIAFLQRHHITVLGRNDADYPARLRDAENPPILLFHLGNANLNAKHILSVVGSRQCTEYGKAMCERFLGELAEICPDTLIVSGLAYGIDINAHRAALDHNLPTLGVLAHGLDQIYPRRHTETARQMLGTGGLLTEYQSGSNADKMNFVARNRIVAAMADATLVVETREKGGSRITARLADEAGRRVFAVPGRIGDEMSTGCNRLIAEGKADIALSARDFVEAMGWQTEAEHAAPIQRTLFVDLGDDEQTILRCLDQNDEGLTLNQLTQLTGNPVSTLTALLFEMEMKGLVKMIAGSRYRKI